MIGDNNRMDGAVVRIDGICVRYRLAKEKPKTLQEYLIHRLKGRRLDYEDFWAVKDVTFEVGMGEALGIIGRNGAGKSTLLKVLAGVIKPTGGGVSVRGTIAPLIELGAGFDMELTGIENIYLNASLLGLSRNEIKSKLQNIVEFSELGDFIYSPLKNYSSGMVARLGFSIATEVKPDVLIIDEILGVGDESFQKRSRERLTSFREMGATMLIVSHSMEEIRVLCDKVLWLDHGMTRLFGDSEHVTKEYQQSV